MTDPVRCAWCGSNMLQAGLDEFQCLACGKQTNMDGTQKVTNVIISVTPIPADLTAGDEFAGQDRRVRPGDTPPAPPVEQPVWADVAGDPLSAMPPAPPAMIEVQGPANAEPVEDVPVVSEPPMVIEVQGPANPEPAPVEVPVESIAEPVPTDSPVEYGGA